MPNKTSVSRYAKNRKKKVKENIPSKKPAKVTIISNEKITTSFNTRQSS